MSEHLRTTVKLLEDAAGYATWETKLRDILTDQDYDEYVFGSKTAEPKINDAANASEVKANADWKRKQVKALSIIRLRVGDSPMAYVRGAKTAKEAWDKLQSIYAPKGAITIIRLRRQLYSLRCGEEQPIEEHLRTLASLRSDLESYGTTFTESDFSTIILTSLPDSWDIWTGSFDLSKLNTLDSETVIARVIQHAKQPTAKPEADSSSTALSAYRSKSGSHAQHNSRPGGCYSCGRPGHREAECRDKQNGRTYTEAQKNANYERAKQNYKGIDRSNSDSANMATEPTRDVAFIARDVHQSTPDSRLLDSGASIHITYNDHHNRQSTTDAAQLQGESTPGTSLTPSPATTTPIQLFLQTDAPIEITGLLITALTSTHLANTDTVRRFSRSIVHHCASTPTLLTPTYTEIDSPVRGGVL